MCMCITRLQQLLYILKNQTTQLGLFLKVVKLQLFLQIDLCIPLKNDYVSSRQAGLL